MKYDYSTSGLLQTPASKEKTFLVDPKISFDSASAFAKGSSRSQKTSPGVARSEVLARWRDNSGPIGQAIRAGRNDLLMAAIRKAKMNNNSH